MDHLMRGDDRNQESFISDANPKGTNAQEFTSSYQPIELLFHVSDGFPKTNAPSQQEKNQQTMINHGSSCCSVGCVFLLMLSSRFLLHLNTPHSSATPPAPQALKQAPPKRWSRSSFRATCAQQSAQSPAPCKQSTSANPAPCEETRPKVVFSCVMWIGGETFGEHLTLENKREKEKKTERKKKNLKYYFTFQLMRTLMER